jgi:DNA polymerase-1
VHDELVLESPEEEVEAAKTLVEQVMESAATLKVRLAVDVGVGRSWLEAKSP